MHIYHRRFPCSFPACLFLLRAGSCISSQPSQMSPPKLAFFFFFPAALRGLVFETQTHLFSWNLQQQSVSRPQPGCTRHAECHSLYKAVKCILWQFVKAPLRMRVELCCGFYFSPAVMPDSHCVRVRFIHNGVWRFRHGENKNVPKCNSHNPPNTLVPLILESIWKPSFFSSAFLFVKWWGKRINVSSTSDTSGSKSLNVNQMIQVPRAQSDVLFRNI